MGEFAMMFSVIWGGLLALLGSIFLTISIVMKKHNANKERNCTVETTGIVINIVERYDTSRNGRGGKSYYPEIEYYANGNAVTQTSGVGTNPCRYVIGQSVGIRYNPKKPGEIILEGDKMLKKISSVFGVVAYILFAIGIAGVILAMVASRSYI